MGDSLAEYNAGRVAGRSDRQPEIYRLQAEIARLQALLVAQEQKIANALEALNA